MADPRGAGLHDPTLDHDACGAGFVADLAGRPATHVLPLALAALGRLAHRGAVDADSRTGDGAGVLTEIPFAVLEADLKTMGLGRARPGELAAGLVFLPREPARAEAAQLLAREALEAQGVPFLGWREVPIREDRLGERARASRPRLAHLLAGRPEGIGAEEFERRLYLARRQMEAQAAEQELREFYVASLSHRTLVYKALVRGLDLAGFYPDLTHPRFATSFALFHQRFSTNTLPSWAMTQPFRLLAHNGEINTIQGNRAWMRAREAGLDCPVLGLRAGGRSPVLQDGTSDSASLDEAMALLRRGGRDLLHALTLLMPPAWESDAELAPSVRDLLEYQSCLMEPWDGPAFVVFSDGSVVGAALDRNGLRPARSLVTVDGLVVVASEAGLVDLEPRRILERGRLGPGDVLAVDLRARRLLDRRTIYERLAARRPYGRWLRAHRVRGVVQSSPRAATASGADTLQLRAFGYTREEMQLVLGPMHGEGREPLGSMGDDTPLSVLSARPRLLFSYFKQRFAQVTNPAIDPLREGLVMSLDTRLGPRGNLLAETPEHAAQVHLPSPILTPEQVEALAGRRLGLLFAADGGEAAFRDALETLLAEAGKAVGEGARLLILSDRGVDAGHAALPSLLAVSAVHQELVRRGLRMRASLLAQTGEARDDHQVATLLGFGAEAVCPYLALQTVRASAPDGEQAVLRYRRALEKGLLKILSKMGISTLASYHGAQLFEAVGVAEELLERHFTGTRSGVGGVGLGELAREVLDRHRSAFASPEAPLEEGSLHRYRRHGERHAFEPEVVKALHAAVRSGRPLDYRRYAELVGAREPVTLRDLLRIVPGRPVPIEEVEGTESLFARFYSSAMSLGALSPEAQRVLALAMNRIGARSNSGEGGEPEELFARGDGSHNRIKQVASARFGVTAAYLTSADELQIKIAQGSKPGEGGQLPGHKVAAHIAQVRHAPAGTTLISPPPHHDIYSIEDLAQLIYDLKRVHPTAAVGVKLVSQAGIGTVAVGVAKTHADSIVVAGHDGGTGASPLGSIKNAGTPWELGLAEVQQALLAGGLRSRVRLQVEGGLRTGRDVVMAALLGADEFGFGTTALLAAGCVMARQCHLNTCPAGIATQREELRRRFRGTPEDVVRFFTAIAEEVREILALLGCRRLEEAVGRSDLLEARKAGASAKSAHLDLGRVVPAAPLPPVPSRRPAFRNEPPEHGGRLDEAVLARLRFAEPAPSPLQMRLEITNADRAVGARIAGELARRIRGLRLPAETVRLELHGSAGQSFGAFCVEGMQLLLEGEANDGVGKGMSGGEIAVRPPRPLAGRAGDVIAGNAILYGATGGRAFLAGRVGERFAVRNSGALAIVEGTGDHACEYMTAGAVVILGETGRNLGAGMSGGVAFVWDPDDRRRRRHNPELVTVGDLVPGREEDWLREAIGRHLRLTASGRARAILERWTEARPDFRRVAPREAPASILPAMRGSVRVPRIPVAARAAAQSVVVASAASTGVTAAWSSSPVRMR